MLYDDEKRPEEDESGRNRNEENNGYGYNRENATPDNNEAPQYSYNNYNGGNQSGGKKPKDSYMSKKTVGWIVALCLVVSIICGICANAVTGIIRNTKTETTTSPSSVTTEDPGKTTDVNGQNQTSTSDNIVPLQR